MPVKEGAARVTFGPFWSKIPTLRFSNPLKMLLYGVCSEPVSGAIPYLSGMIQGIFGIM